MSVSNIENAGDLAEQVALQIQKSNGNLRTVYHKLEEILINYRKNNVDVDLIMPAIYEVNKVWYTSTTFLARGISLIKVNMTKLAIYLIAILQKGTTLWNQSIIIYMICRLKYLRELGYTINTTTTTTFVTVSEYFTVKI